MDAETWHIPLRDDSITIRKALKSMESFKLDPNDVPPIIRFMENPKYNLLPGAVTLEMHDIIHVLLGRGLLVKDEAFVIGFTMGTSRPMTKLEKLSFLFVTRFLYPVGYRFRKEEIEIFENGLRLGKRMGCPDLSEVDLTQYLSYTIEKARKKLNFDVGELMKEYILEKSAYDSPESKRLI